MPFMESRTRVHMLSPLKLWLTLWLCVLLSTVSVRGNYEFTIRFYEFRNTLGLQCGACESDGPPACCDDVQRNENCVNEEDGPLRCDTRFRFLLRPFGASVETAPSGGFPHFTPSNGGNSDTFIEAPGGFLALPNPFIISNTSEWTGRIQFFIDALDRAVSGSGVAEIEAIINRFSIDLDLELGAAFTERTTYTGIYNISDLGFDMSFRVQCSENYYGPNCTTFCEPLEGVYTCNSEGRVICVQSSRDPATKCATCLPGWDTETSCTTCLSPFYDIQANCTQCVAGRDISTHCTTCLSGYDPSPNCAECLSGRDINTSCETCLLPGYDPSTNCTQCLTCRDSSTNCTTCLQAGYDPSTNCTQCLPGYDLSTNCTAQITTSGIATPTSTADTIGRTVDIAVVGGAVGGAAVIIILILVVLCVVIVIMTLQLRRQRRKFTVAGTNTGLNNLSRDSSVKESVETARMAGEHDFDNPLYDESKQNGSRWEAADNSAYSKLERPPKQKSFAPPKFPYTTEHTEEASYQLDVAGKGADDTINNEQPEYDIAYPPPPPPSFNEMGGAYDVTNQPNRQFLGVSPSAIAGGIYNLANYPERSDYEDTNLPLRGSTRLPRNDYTDITDTPGSTMTTSSQHDYADIPDPHSSGKAAPHYDYADTALSMSSPPPPAASSDLTAAHEYEYAETTDVMKSTQYPSAYANTTPGQVTREAMEHYDLGH